MTIAGVVAFSVAAAYALVSQLTGRTSEWIYTTPLGVVLFGAGTALTTVTIVLDGALIGVRQGSRQVSRNLIFSVVKLVALPIAAFAIGLSPHAIFSVWLLGNFVSLLIVALRTETRREWLTTLPSPRGFYPIWRTAAGHHWVNVATETPRFALPILVAAQLGNEANAGFYAALLLISFVWVVPHHLATGMFAIQSDDPDHFRRGLSTAVRLSAGVSLLAAVGTPVLARPLLAIFGPEYVRASYCLMALGICTIGSAMKSIYIAVGRAQGMLGKAAMAALFGAGIELGAAEIGLTLWGVTGVGIGVGIALMLEAAVFWPSIRRVQNQLPDDERTHRNSRVADAEESCARQAPLQPEFEGQQ
ncbi:teichoic acid transporter [Mycobacterium sp. GA-2829]|uniref:teichoic acid transporter n=1 Tax=Mycobacterium sp. GA-2829 TaxID=1772283 RepID=UPI001E58FCE4|nr:teichoic acid transporter [Mycobacterium sp. GA-2829]